MKTTEKINSDLFELIECFPLTLPKNYSIVNYRDFLFKKQNSNFFSYLNPELTGDKYFLATSDHLNFRRTLKVNIFKIKTSKEAKIEDIYSFMEENDQIGTGVIGIQLVLESNKKKLPYGNWILSLGNNILNENDKTPYIVRGRNNQYFFSLCKNYQTLYDEDHFLTFQKL